MRRSLRRWGPAILQMALIFGASSIPNLQGLPAGVSDKTGHFVGYAILGVCVLHAVVADRWAGVTRRHAWQALAISSIYGMFDEFHQRFVPGRSPDVNDWIADTLGAGAAILVLLILAALNRRPAVGAGDSSRDQ